VGVGTYLILQAQSDQRSADSAPVRIANRADGGAVFQTLGTARRCPTPPRTNAMPGTAHANDLSNDAKIMKWGRLGHRRVEGRRL